MIAGFSWPTGRPELDVLSDGDPDAPARLAAELRAVRAQLAYAEQCADALYAYLRSRGLTASQPRGLWSHERGGAACVACARPVAAGQAACAFCATPAVRHAGRQRCG